MNARYIALLGASLLLPATAAAQHAGHHGHDGHDMPAPTPVAAGEAAAPHSHQGGHGDEALTANAVAASGTALLPASEGAMSGLHLMSGDWMVMVHGAATAFYTDQSGPRGDKGAYVASMMMIDADRRTDWGGVQLRAMLSLDPLMGKRGYPILFATGETANGIPLVDRQHPHDAFMELSARVDGDLAPGLKGFLYGGPVAEPALGPAAFMHRRSSRYNPEAPITHHWFDSTHVTFGVLTAGLAGKTWQIEGSAFRGAEPDEARWDIETPRLDSWSARATWMPSPHFSAQISHGWLKEPEATHPGENERRTTASVHYADGPLSVTAAASFKARGDHGHATSALLAEANWDVTARHSLFGRIESVNNDELFPDHADPLHDVAFRVTKLQIGYAYRLPLGSDFNLALGGALSGFLKPAALDAVYGRNPMGAAVFARLSLGD